MNFQALEKYWNFVDPGKGFEIVTDPNLLSLHHYSHRARSSVVRQHVAVVHELNTDKKEDLKKGQKIFFSDEKDKKKDKKGQKKRFKKND